MGKEKVGDGFGPLTYVLDKNSTKMHRAVIAAAVYKGCSTHWGVPLVRMPAMQVKLCTPPPAPDRHPDVTQPDCTPPAPLPFSTPIPPRRFPTRT